MALLSNSQHEAFAQARFSGKSLLEAHYAAGYAGDKATASRLNHLPEITERIAELYREAAAQTTYEKSHAVQDLLAIIHACASEAAEDNPLCEVRIGKHGPYYRFPPKLQAMARLIKLMGWDEPVKVEVELKDNCRELLASIRRRPSPQKHSTIPPATSDPIRRISPIGPTPAATGPSNNSPITSQESPACPLSPRQEQFANARVKGLGVMEAYHAAGYTGDSPNLAWRLNSLPAVKARIAELNGGVEAVTGYGKDDAIRDLVAILRSRPSDAGPDHPLCEMRMSAWGQYHRFPSKLATITLLAKMLGWAQPMQVQIDHDPDAGFKQLTESLRHRS
jgi:phage terminase small subunit